MIATLKLYAQLASKAVPRALRAWPAALPLLIYPYLLALAGSLLAPLGFLGGFILGAVAALLISSYLHFLDKAVAGTRIGPGDLIPSFTAHFSDVLTVGFVFWIGSFLLGKLTAPMPDTQRTTILLLVGLVTAVFLNPLPEVLYQRRTGGYFGHLAEAARFVTAHWPSWLLPNILLGAVLLSPFGFLRASAGERLLALDTLFSLMGPAVISSRVPLWLTPIMLLFIHWAMVFRGLLFQELSTGMSARQRAIRDAWRR